MNIVMLVGEGDSSKIVYNAICNDFDIKMVIEDTPLSKKLQALLKASMQRWH